MPAYVLLWMRLGEDRLEFGETLSGFLGKGKTKLWKELPWKLDATSRYKKTTLYIHFNVFNASISVFSQGLMAWSKYWKLKHSLDSIKIKSIWLQIRALLLCSKPYLKANIERKCCILGATWPACILCLVLSFTDLIFGSNFRSHSTRNVFIGN